MSSTAGIVALVGRANVGKSSIFNAVVGRREAITATEAGTTRDRLTAKAQFGNHDFWLVDTAGLKSAEDELELSIQEQIGQAADAANVIVVVVDATAGISDEDRRVAKLALKSSKPVLLAINKVDVNKNADLDIWRALGIKTAIAVSAIHKTGLDELLDQVVSYLPKKKIVDDPNRIKLAILGRPNVGKSSIFNALAGSDRAIVAEQAGTTRDINRLSVSWGGKTIEVLDTAGIRRSGKIARGIEQFSVVRSLAAIEEADVCLLVIEATEPSVRLDQKIAGLIKTSGRGLVLTLNKWDKVTDKAEERPKIMRLVKADYDFTPWAPLVIVSAATGENIPKILDLVAQISQTRRQKISTPELNRWLRGAVAHHPPAGLKGRQPKLNYITQEQDQSFPNFKIFGSQVKLLHWSYRRYLERSFREKWPLAGTPIKFWFIEKK